MSNSVDADGGWLYATVDASDNSTTVFTGPCRVRAAWVNTGLSAHVLPIKDGSTTVRSFAASAAANAELRFYDALFQTSLIADPDDSATGAIVIVYKPEPEIR